MPKLYKWSAVILFVAWAFFAGLWPLVEHDFNLSAVQAVWARWQAWNTGVIALLAALIALAVAQLRDERERQRSFNAAKAMLPDHLSSLLSYLEATQGYLTTAYAKASGETEAVPTAPVRPNGYEQWISDAIRWGDPAFVSYVSQIISNLQIYRSCISEVSALLSEPGLEHKSGDNSNIREYIVQGAILYTQIGHLLAYARDDDKLPDEITHEDLQSALRLCKIYFADNFGIDQSLLKRRAETENECLRDRI